MKIGIIGGGFTGLVLAQKLSVSGHQVQIFEQDEQIGGLATYHWFDSFHWDRFYHVILPFDNYLLDFLRSIGLEEKLRWKKTFTGVYVDRQFYSVSNSKEFLLFPPLNLFQKARLAFTILYASRIQDWKSMERLTSEEWLIRIGGRGTYEKFWKPLLMAKLGDAYRRVSAVFIWTYIKRLFEARNASAHQEQMGYVSGGYKTVFDRLEVLFAQQGVKLHKGVGVEWIGPSADGGIAVRHEKGEETFDKVIFTAPVNILEKVVEPSLYQMQKGPSAVEYLGVVCMVLLTKKPFTPFYVLNIADEQIPFTGVIGISSLVEVVETGGYHLTYLPKYVLSTDPILRKSDEEIKDWFMQGLARMYPDLAAGDIAGVFINRAVKVQPLQVLNYSEIIPQTQTLHPDFYILNTSQFVNGTLNNDSVARHVAQFLENHQEVFSNQELASASKVY